MPSQLTGTMDDFYGLRHQCDVAGRQSWVTAIDLALRDGRAVAPEVDGFAEVELIVLADPTKRLDLTDPEQCVTDVERAWEDARARARGQLPPRIPPTSWARLLEEDAL